MRNLVGVELRSEILSGSPKSPRPVLLQMLEEAKINAVDTKWTLSSDSKLVKSLFSVFCILDWVSCSILADPFVYFFSVTESQIVLSGRSELVPIFRKIQMLTFDGELRGELVQVPPSQIWNAVKHASLLAIVTESHYKLKDCYKIGEVLISRSSVVKIIDLTKRLVEETYKK